jgi:uncharacterized repeat protein (TIGR03803 family)
MLIGVTVIENTAPQLVMDMVAMIICRRHYCSEYPTQSGFNYGSLVRCGNRCGAPRPTPRFRCPAGGGLGCGTVFSLTPPTNGIGSWTEAVIYQFRCVPDGEFAQANLVIDPNGVIYGTTSKGGTAPICSSGCGTVFSLPPPTSSGGEWIEAVIWSFNGGADGFAPSPGVVIGAGGVLYGTTYSGGNSDNGTVFSLTPAVVADAPWVKALLYEFPRNPQQHPETVALGTDGLLYGTTNLKKKGSQGGTVFALAPPGNLGAPWTKTTLFAFRARSLAAQTSDQPDGPLVTDGKKGTLFGATGDGNGLGTLARWNRRTPPVAERLRRLILEANHQATEHVWVYTCSLLMGKLREEEKLPACISLLPQPTPR